MNIELLDPSEFDAPIAIISGGWSKERDRSIRSGRTVAASLARQGVETVWIDSNDRDTLVKQLSGVSLAVLAIAGRGAEDGCLQGFLETLGIAYTGSGVLASALGMRKNIAKTVVHAVGIDTPRCVVVGSAGDVRAEAERIARQLGLPVVVKPVNEGGSIGVRTVHTVDELAHELEENVEHNTMVEQFLAGRSISVGVLESHHGEFHVLPALEAETPEEVYSYAAKRELSACTYHCPARVAAETHQLLADRAIAAHRALGCRGYSRHDFIVTDDGQAWWLEVNTLPGMQTIGNIARMAVAGGLSYDQLVAHIVRSACQDRRASQ